MLKRLSLIVGVLVLAACQESPPEWYIYDVTVNGDRYFPVAYTDLPQLDNKGCVSFFTDGPTLTQLCDVQSFNASRYSSLDEYKAMQGIQDGIDTFWREHPDGFPDK